MKLKRRGEPVAQRNFDKAPSAQAAIMSSATNRIVALCKKTKEPKRKNALPVLSGTTVQPPPPLPADNSDLRDIYAAVTGRAPGDQS
jgi:hypothetical protein